jgi:K(+)-stimulated pyrophosphate-energized sodium pump
VDLITQFPLGTDIAVLLLALAVLAVGAVVLGFVVPPRLARHGAAVARRRAEDAEPGIETGEQVPVAADEDDPDVATEEDSDTGDHVVDATLGRRLGSLMTSGTIVSLWVGIPLALLLLLMPGTNEVKILRGGMVLVGLFAGAIAAWRASGMMLQGLAIAPSDRGRALSRFGGVFVGSALGIAAMPIAIAVFFLHQSASSSLIGYAVGAAVFALGLHAVASLAHAAGHTSTLLAGTDENGIDTENLDNPGAAHLHVALLLRRGPARAATLVALAAAVVGVGIRVGVPVFAAEGLLVPLLALTVALAASLVVALVAHMGRDGHERTVLRLGGLIPAVVGVGGMAAALALWIPSAYKKLRFARVGMDTITDQAITGSNDPVPRSQIEPQIDKAITDMSQWVDATDESSYATGFLDELTKYGIHPNSVVAIALCLGALAALVVPFVVGRILGARSGSALRGARTSRTGGALGAITSLATSVLAGVLAVGAVGIVLAVLSVIGKGVPDLMAALVTIAAAGGLVVVAAGASLHTGSAIADRPATPPAWREGTRGGTLESASGIHVTVVLVALGVIAPIAGAITQAGRADSVWEDRALHALTPSALPVAGGIGLGVLSVGLIAAGILHGIHRVGISAMVETREAFLDHRTTVGFEELPYRSRRAVLAPVATALLMPIVAGFGLGPSAVPAYVASVVLLGGGMAVLSTVFEGTTGRSVDVIRSGRYGGPGSWGHSGALSTAVLGGAVQGALGTLISIASLAGALVALLTVSGAVNVMVDGTNMFLRWGAAVLALLVVLACWIYALTAPETDLEDEFTEDFAPLFAGEDEADDGDASQEGDLLLDWAADDDDEAGYAEDSDAADGTDGEAQDGAGRTAGPQAAGASRGRSTAAKKPKRKRKR